MCFYYSKPSTSKVHLQGSVSLKLLSLNSWERHLIKWSRSQILFNYEHKGTCICQLMTGMNQTIRMQDEPKNIIIIHIFPRLDSCTKACVSNATAHLLAHKMAVISVHNNHWYWITKGSSMKFNGLFTKNLISDKCPYGSGCTFKQTETE